MSDASAAGTLTLAGHEVPRMGYGAMRLTGSRIVGPPPDRAEAVRVVRRAIELGVRVVDCAWYYGPFSSHEILAEALRPYSEDLVFVSKLGAGRGEDGSWFPMLTPEGLRAGIEHDLRVLGVDAVPVVHLRWMDQPEAGFLEALDAMMALRDEGKLRHVGLSNVSLEQLNLALGRTEVATVSNQFSVLDRSDEPVLRRCAERGIAYLPFFPLGASPVNPRAKAAADRRVSGVADRLGATPAQVALAWLLHVSPAVVTIPGTSGVAHLEENVAAAQLRLDDDALDELDAIGGRA